MELHGSSAPAGITAAVVTRPVGVGALDAGNGVVFTEVGPRDGLQNLDTTVPTPVKADLVRDLLATGVSRVEATSFVSPRWVPQLADAADLLAALGDDLFPRLRVLVPNLRGLEMALEHGVAAVVVTVGATDSFNRRNVNRSVAESLRDLEVIVERGHAAGCQVDVALSVAFGCPYEGWVAPRRVIDICRELVRLGVDEVGLADTIGVAGPAEVRDLVMRAQAVVPGDRLSLHVHDTRGLGVANVLAAFEVGVRRFEGSVGGLGGCPFAPGAAGNVCSEDALYALERVGGRTGVDLEAYCAVARGLGVTLGRDLPGRLHRAGVWRPVGDAAAVVGDKDAGVGLGGPGAAIAADGEPAR